MKSGKTSAAALGLAGGLALGVWIGSEMTSGRETAAQPEPAPVVAVETPAAEAPVKPKRAPRVVRASTPVAVADRDAESTATSIPAESAPKLVMTIPVSAPELHSRLKPVLARGTKIPLAIEGFSDAEQFATLAHASRNTQVPFILLKHRVLTEGQSLEDAIRASKPDLDVRVEAQRARQAAKSDIAALATHSASSY
jgi:hypothetical protein